MAARRDESQELSRFADALREFLGLAPLYQTGDGRKRRTDAERFYVDSFPDVTAQPRR